MTKDSKPGEGNREADRNYREGARDTVENTTEQERAEQARLKDDETLSELREAEERARKGSK